ncbi:10223_t:CDS:10 [Entrophospora sp. SA101]|nr:10223_t:CDS:10 [Entrophospora sp. SA101]
MFIQNIGQYISVVRISDEREILNVEFLGLPFRSTKDHTVGDVKKLLIMAVCSLCYSLGDYLDCSVEDAKKVKSYSIQVIVLEENTGTICSEHIIQPTPLGPFWTEIDDDGIIDGDLPAFTINIFDSGDEKSSEAMYAEAVKDTYFDNSSDTSSLITKVTNRITPSFKDNFGFQPNRETQSYITTIIYPTSRNSSFFAPGVAGFMIDPHNFVLETRTEQRQFLSVISNVLAVWGTFLTLYAILFGVGRIKPWGVIQKHFFKKHTHDELKALIPPSLFLEIGESNRTLTTEERLDRLTVLLMQLIQKHLKKSKTHERYKNTSIPPSLFLKIDEGNRTLTTEERLDRLTALIIEHVIEISELDEKLKKNNSDASRATGKTAAAATLSQ